MRSVVVAAAVVGIGLTCVSAGSPSNSEVANVAKTSGITYRQDSATITRALRRLNLDSLSSVNALAEDGFALKADMRASRQLMARTTASTKAGRAGRTLLLLGLAALEASGDYMLQYGRALGSSASPTVLQVDSDGYQLKRHKGELLAQRGAALLGVSFG